MSLGSMLNTLHCFHNKVTHIHASWWTCVLVICWSLVFHTQAINGLFHQQREMADIYSHILSLCFKQMFSIFVLELNDLYCCCFDTNVVLNQVLHWSVSLPTLLKDCFQISCLWTPLGRLKHIAAVKAELHFNDHVSANTSRCRAVDTSTGICLHTTCIHMQHERIHHMERGHMNRTGIYRNRKTNKNTVSEPKQSRKDNIWCKFDLKSAVGKKKVGSVRSQILSKTFLSHFHSSVSGAQETSV